MPETSYDLGDIARLTVAFTVDDVPTDPTQISLSVRQPDGDTQVIIGSDYTIPSGPIVHDGTGNFYYDLVVNQAGEWSYKFVGSGTAADVGQGSLYVTPDFTTSDTVGLTTLRSLRRWVLRDATDDSKDDKLVEYGEAFSLRVSQYCRRQFQPDPATDLDDPVEHVFSYDGSGLLDLKPYELRVSNDLEIKLYTDRDTGLQQTLDATDYRLLPVGGNPQGTYQAVSLILPSLAEERYGFGWQVTITGRWGMAAVPKTVELAVWICVDDAMKNPGSFASQQLNGYLVQTDNVDPSFDFDDRGSLPRGAMRALAPYRRRRRLGTLNAATPGTTVGARFGRDLPRV